RPETCSGDRNMYGTRPSPWQTEQPGRPVFLVPLAAIHAAQAGQVRQASRGKRTGSSVSISVFFIFINIALFELFHLSIQIYCRLTRSWRFFDLLIEFVGYFRGWDFRPFEEFRVEKKRVFVCRRSEQSQRRKLAYRQL
ncbi:hypothetical protein ADUPG1_003421, partial [Aduncisulcus paluster]